MLTQVEARTSQGALLILPLGESTNGLVIEDIQGLDPVKATLVSSSFANQDGAQYHSSRRETRNIKLSLGFEPDYELQSIRDLRKNVYDFFMPKSQVELKFRIATDLDLDPFGEAGLVVTILGRVESCESAMFSKDPVVEISMMCFDPDFYELDPLVVGGHTTSTLLETTMTYSGTVETGISFELEVDRSISAFSIYHRPPDETFRIMDFSALLDAGDTLRVTTTAGSKSVVRIRGGVETSLLYALSPQSNWIELQPGENHFRVYAEGAAIPYTFEYTNKYGGL